MKPVLAYSLVTAAVLVALGCDRPQHLTVAAQQSAVQATCRQAVIGDQAVSFTPPLAFTIPGGLVCEGQCDAVAKLDLTIVHAHDSNPATLRDSTSICSYIKDSATTLRLDHCGNNRPTVDVVAGEPVRATSLAVAGRTSGDAPTPITLTLGEVVELDDGNPCTADACDPAHGPTHTPIAGCQWVPTATPSSIDPTVATNFGDVVQFLYDGPGRVQAGVEPGTIDAQHVAVIRGSAHGRDGAALTGVGITVVGRPEYGQTFTRADGAFDLAVNGGESLVVRLEKAGYLPAQRRIGTAWNRFALLADVVLVPLDPQTALATFGSATSQVLRGPQSQDTNGARQPTVIVPAGAQASLVMADGSTQPLAVGHLHMTEFTIGPSGPKAMPGDLPPASGYTYAVDFTVDEAVAVGASQVRFDHPLPVYLENFLGFPAGTQVPAGAFDAASHRWLASDNGIVLTVMAVGSGGATLDVTGDGVADDDATLQALGISADERRQLGTIYQPGQSLWRVPVPHFSIWDFNWGFGPPDDADSGLLDAIKDLIDATSCQQGGSIIDCQNRTLGEDFPVAGTPFTLHYQSDRVPGRAAARNVTIRLSSSKLPASVKRVDIEVDIAGRASFFSRPPASLIEITFEWDGLDAYGRAWNGAQPAVIKAGYVYDGVYRVTSRFGRSGGSNIGGSIPRAEVILYSPSVTVSLGIGYDAFAAGFGGLTLDAHHFYDPNNRTIQYGDGRRRAASDVGHVISTLVGGGGLSGTAGDGHPGTAVALVRPRGLAYGADGSLYISDFTAIRRLDRNGLMATIAGNPIGDSSDGIPATQASIHAESMAIGPAGDVYFVDGERIRRVAPNGIVDTYAGLGATPGGDEGPARDAGFSSITNIASGPDGSVYVVDWGGGQSVIRRIEPDGIISRFAGGGSDTRDGVPALQAQLFSPYSVAVTADGTVYVGTSSAIRRIEPSGRITTVKSFDGTALGFPYALTAAPDGTTLFMASGNRIYRITGDGTAAPFAGSGDSGTKGDGGPAMAAGFGNVTCLVVGPDGALLAGDQWEQRVRRIGDFVPGAGGNGFVIPSDDGTQAYVFDHHGRHLKTLDTSTHAELVSFEYNASGHLVSVKDVDGDVVQVARNIADLASTITGPFGQVTTLAYRSDGFVQSITNPAQETVTLTYKSDGSGLLETLTEPRGDLHQFTWDGGGRLLRDTRPWGGWKELSATPQTADRTFTLTTSEGRIFQYRTVQTPDGVQTRTNTAPDGTQTIVHTDAAANSTVNLPDGRVFHVTPRPDVLFGAQVPRLGNATESLPSGKSRSFSSSASLHLAVPTDPLSLDDLSESTTVNGHTWIRHYDGVAHTATVTTPMGRTVTTTLDAHGRPAHVATPIGLPLDIVYDAHGRLATATRGGRVSHYGYDTNGFLATATDPLSQVQQISFDVVGRLHDLLRPDNNHALFGYDVNSNLTSVTPPGRAAHAQSYGAGNLPSTYTPPLVTDLGAIATAVSFDSDAALKTVTRADGGTLGFTYDNLSGKLATLSAGAESLAFTFDGPFLARTTFAGAVAGTVQNTYDNDFHLAHEQVQGDDIAFTYDADGLITGAGAETLVWNASTPRLESATVGDVVTTLGYSSDFGELSHHDAKWQQQVLYSADFTRDGLGRIATKSESVAGQATTWGYGYDAVGRLRDVTKNGVAWAHYDYDANGNRASAAGATYDAQDRLRSLGAITFSYGKDGDLSSRVSGGQTTQYDYDAFGSLASVTLPDGRLIEYVSDGLHRRVAKKVNGVMTRGYLYRDAARPVAELDGSGAVVSRFVYGTRPFVPDYAIKNGKTYKLISDYLGSVRLVVDIATGAVAQRLDYDEFGNVVADTSPGFQPFGYAGGLYDADTGLVRLGARDYDAAVGRWTSKDPSGLAGGLGLYVYAENDPVNFVDVDGQNPIWALAAIGFIEGGAMAGAMSIIDQALTNGCVDYQAAGRDALFGGVTGALFAGAPLGSSASSAAGDGTAARVAALRDAIPAGSRGRITMAVGLAEDASGARQVLVGTSEPRGYLRPGVTLAPGEKIAPGLGHAEADIVNYAQQNGLRLLEVGATRPICPACAATIEGAGARAVTPLTVP